MGVPDLVQVKKIYYIQPIVPCSGRESTLEKMSVDSIQD